MDVSDFNESYARMGDDELLNLWANQTALVPEAVLALDIELQKRGLNKQNASRVKKRLDALEAREKNGLFLNQVAAAKYERNMRHFVGWEEPEFSSPYGSRDIRNTFAHIRHKYRVWRAFRDHTGHWPLFSIWFHFLSWIAVLGLSLAVFVWVDESTQKRGWSIVGVIVFVLVLLVARDWGARLMRRLDWKRCG